MNLLGGALGAVFMTALSYKTVEIINRKKDMSLCKTGKWITARSVLLSEAAVFCTAFWIAKKTAGSGIPFVTIQYILLWGMSVLSVTDYKIHIIPNRILFIMLMLWTAVTGMYMIASIERGLAFFFQSLAGGIAGGFIFLLCYLLSRKQLGAGDVKLAFIMGLYLTGQRVIGAIFYGIILCLFYSLVQLARGKIGLKDGVPLAPFLFAGVVLAFFILL